MDAWLKDLPLLPNSKARMEDRDRWPEVLALKIFDRGVARDPTTHGYAHERIRAVLDPTTILESVTRVRDFDPLNISKRDCQVFLAAIQWLGTNQGRKFSEDLLKEFESQSKRRR